MRKKFIAGNWKMHKNFKDASIYIKKFKPLVKDAKNSDIVLAVPSTLLQMAASLLKNTRISIAAQDVYFEKEGAFTGEISPLMVKEFASYVIIGHSERRKYFSESDELINKKLNAALGFGLKVIFCVGETQQERNSHKTKEVIARQLDKGLAGISVLRNIIIAYEPVWAIGTGNNATPEQAEEVHSFIRQKIVSMFSSQQAEKLRIIYGGSVTPDNAASLLCMPDIDGCLPGGASLDPVKFAKIIKSV